MSSKISYLKRRNYRASSVYPIYLEYWVNTHTKNKSVSRWQLLEPAILSETVPSNSVNLRSHQHGQNRKKMKPILSRYITFIAFPNMGNR